MKFRPCIDLHNGRVKQIVGSTLSDDSPGSLRTNFSSEFPPSHYAAMYRRDNLPGGHIIKLGPGNDHAAEDALAAWPGGLQLGGGITAENAVHWLEKGASHVIVTSYVFHDGRLDEDRLEGLLRETGRKHLVLDLSCRWRDDSYYVVTDRWQKFTELTVDKQCLDFLSSYCDEFLVHAVDVEGQSLGVDKRLVALLAEHAVISVTYAGGIGDMEDLVLIREVGEGRLDATVGSALDIFGGSGLRYEDVLAFHRKGLRHG